MVEGEAGGNPGGSQAPVLFTLPGHFSGPIALSVGKAKAVGRKCNNIYPAVAVFKPRWLKLN